MRYSCCPARLLAVVALLSVAACAAESADPADTPFDSEDQKVSYGIGYNVASGLVPVAGRIDMDAVARGFRDALDEADPAIPAEEIHSLLQTFQADLAQASLEAAQAQAGASRAEADSFLVANAGRDGVSTTESGLQYEVIEPGTGPRPSGDDRVTVHYSGTLVDGTKFDSSYDRNEPATFSLQGVIAGFAEGLQLMPVGSKYRLFIPPELGYGPAGSGRIPPGAALVFELELLAIE